METNNLNVFSLCLMSTYGSHEGKNMCIVNLLSFIITNSLYRYNYSYGEVNPLVPKSSL